MLPKSTEVVEKFREDSEFFKNQVYREAKRNAAMDYELIRTASINFGEMFLRITSY